MNSDHVNNVLHTTFHAKVKTEDEDTVKVAKDKKNKKESETTRKGKKMENWWILKMG